MLIHVTSRDIPQQTFLVIRLTDETKRNPVIRFPELDVVCQLRSFMCVLSCVSVTQFFRNVGPLASTSISWQKGHVNAGDDSFVRLLQISLIESSIKS